MEKKRREGKLEKEKLGESNDFVVLNTIDSSLF